MYSSNNECVQAARTCSWSQEHGLHLTRSEKYPPCPATNLILNTTVHDLRNISQKDNISPADIKVAAALVDQALQVGAWDEPIPIIITVLFLHVLILLQHEGYSYSA
jgi:hypothetical protein